jgi:hypothetical protein
MAGQAAGVSRKSTPLLETKSQSYPRLDFLQPVRWEFFLSCTSSNMMNAQPIERENLQKEVFCSRGTDPYVKHHTARCPGREGLL